MFGPNLIDFNNNSEKDNYVSVLGSFNCCFHLNYKNFTQDKHFNLTLRWQFLTRKVLQCAHPTICIRERNTAWIFWSTITACQLTYPEKRTTFLRLNQRNPNILSLKRISSTVLLIFYVSLLLTLWKRFVHFTSA